MPEGGFEEFTACGSFHAELGPYLEGETRPALVEHAQRCAFCSVVLGDLEQIRAVSRQLPPDEPPARLWAKVRAGLILEGIIYVPESFWQRWFRGILSPIPVTALACLIVLGIAFLRSPRPFAPEKALISAVPAPDSQVASALNEMQSSYEIQATSLDPVLRASYQKGLQSLDGEIKECADSLRRDPHDALARQYLDAAYAEKAQVLQSALEFVAR